MITVKLVLAVYVIGLVGALFLVGGWGYDEDDLMAYLWPLVVAMVIFIGMVHVVMLPGQLVRDAGYWVRNKYFPPKPQGDGPTVDEE